MPVACTCEVCGTVFNVKPSRIKEGRGKHCSKKCSNIAIFAKIECLCEQCGRAFLLSPGQIKQRSGKYCSSDCRYTAANKQCVCEQCGTVFSRTFSAIKKRSDKYCSRQCYTASLGSVDRKCEQCGKLIHVPPSRIKEGVGKYCSILCMGIARQGENSPVWRGGHSSYRGKNWQQQRKLAYGRDRGTCQYCGKKPGKGERRNAVHHIKPYREFNGDYINANQLTNLITLCHKCHKPAEIGKIAVQPYLF